MVAQVERVCWEPTPTGMCRQPASRFDIDKCRYLCAQHDDSSANSDPLRERIVQALNRADLEQFRLGERHWEVDGQSCYLPSTQAGWMMLAEGKSKIIYYCAPKIDREAEIAVLEQYRSLLEDAGLRVTLVDWHHTIAASRLKVGLADAAVVD